MNFNEYLKEVWSKRENGQLKYIVTYRENGKDYTMKVNAKDEDEAMNKARKMLSADRVAKVIKAELDTREQQ